jgi:hypothetical protein
MPGSRVDEAVTASVGRVAAQLSCHTISVERPFSPRIDAVPGCPAAELAAIHRQYQAPLSRFLGRRLIQIIASAL